MTYDPLRNIVQAVADDISRGHVIPVVKVKHKEHGGKQIVSVGPYQTATGPRQYAMFGKVDYLISPAAWDVAKEFVDFVGRDIARHAVRVTRWRRQAEQARRIKECQESSKTQGEA